MTDLDSVPERTWILAGSPENYEATRELGSMRLTSDMFEDRAPVWPAENWMLAFQGQLRTVSERDARVLTEAMGERARTPA